jgi:hypothetical protein
MSYATNDGDGTFSYTWPIETPNYSSLRALLTADFTISAAPASVSIAQGDTGKFTISTSVLGNFSNDVSLTASGLPPGATAAFSTNPIMPPGSSTLTIAVDSSSSSGTYPITVTGIGGGITHTTTVNLTILRVFNITSSVTGGNGGTVTPNSEIIPSGGRAVITITPAVGYYLASLIDDGSDVTKSVNAAGYAIDNVTSDHTVIAAFSVIDINTYSVTGSVSSGSGSITPASSTVNYGRPVTFTVTPEAGFFLQGLTDNGSIVPATPNGNGSYTYTIASVTENHTIQATFAQTVEVVPAIGLWGFLAVVSGLGLARAFSWL